MWRVLLAACAVALCACGSSGGSTDAGTGSIAIGGPGDNAPAFVGNWSGNLTIADQGSGQNETTSAVIPILETAANTILLDGACPDNSGLPAIVTSATQFGISAPFACPPDTSEASCASIVFTFTTLSGSLNGTSLEFSGQLGVAGCGQTDTGTISFSSTSKSTVVHAALESLGQRLAQKVPH
jgi:hypothetical protein